MSLFTSHLEANKPLTTASAKHLEMALRKIAAEAFIIEAELTDNLSNGIYPSRVDLESLLDHLRFLKRELGEQQPLSPNSALNLALSRIIESTRNWLNNTIELFSFSELSQLSHEYFQNFRSQLHQILGLCSHHIDQKRLKSISLLEFDSEFSGASHHIVEQIISLEKELFIDPNLNLPQNGFGAIEDEDQIYGSLASRESRLFTLMQNNSLEGFYIQELNSQSVRLNHSELCNKLHSLNLLSPEQKVGYCRIVGIRRATLNAHIREGIDLYQLLDNSIVSTAKSEGVDVLLGLVREGPNANTSINSHRRVGWEMTQATLLGADGKTPYRILSRRLDYEHGKPERAYIGESSHFKRWNNQLSLRFPDLENAAPISYSNAIESCQRFFAELRLSVDIRYSFGAYAFYITIADSYNRNVHYNLHQLRPRTDYWNYFDHSDSRGSLSEMLLMISDDIISSRLGYFNAR